APLRRAGDPAAEPDPAGGGPLVGPTLARRRAGGGPPGRSVPPPRRLRSGGDPHAAPLHALRREPAERSTGGLVLLAPPHREPHRGDTAGDRPAGRARGAGGSPAPSRAAADSGILPGVPAAGDRAPADSGLSRVPSMMIPIVLSIAGS